MQRSGVLDAYPEHRRRGGPDPRQRLRHGLRRRGHGRAAPHHRRLRHPPERGRRAAGGPRVRGQRARRPHHGPPPAGGRPARRAEHPGHRRHPPAASTRALRRLTAMLPAANDVQPRAGAGVAPDGRPAVRRLRRLFSGITANPALGAAVDELVRHGGTAILSETPEIYGAEHLLTRRAVTRRGGSRRSCDQIRWWEDYTARNHGEMNNNPSPGQQGRRAHHHPREVARRGGQGRHHRPHGGLRATPRRSPPAGSSTWTRPGYDPVSVTGQVAGGANLVVFTTGRGSAYGCIPSPSIKLSTNTALYERQRDDIDIDCGPVLDGTVPVADMGRRHLRRDAARGLGRADEERSCSATATTSSPPGSSGPRCDVVPEGRGDLLRDDHAPGVDDQLGHLVVVDGGQDDLDPLVAQVRRTG